MSEPVTIAHQGNIAVITVDSPPVNALSLAVRAGLQDCFEKARQSMPDLPDHPSSHVANQLVEMGRLGQKSSAASTAMTRRSGSGLRLRRLKR